MKKNIAIIFMIVLLVVLLVACDMPNDTPDHVCEFGEWTAVKKATCVEKGQIERCCDCGKKETNVLAMVEHSYTAVVTQPTCTIQGYTTHTCECGDSYTDTYVSATGHTADVIVVENVVNATCTKDGSYDNVVYCTTCDAELSREIKNVEAFGHDEIEYAAQEPTCTEIGWDAYVACSRCNYSTRNVIPATGHNSITSEVVEPTCTNSGYTVHICSCGCRYQDTYISATGHNSIRSEVVEPTCESSGYTIHVCSCGYRYQDTYISATGHKLGDWYVAKEPTIAAAGEKRRTCDYCNYYVSETLEALGYVGTWGNLNWTLNKSTGELVISGTGPMDDFPNNYSRPVWKGSDVAVQSVIIEDGVTSIGNYAFWNMPLTSIDIPDSVTRIGYRALEACMNLERLNIPSSVKIIEEGAFSACSTSLTSIVVDENNLFYHSENGCLIETETKTLILGYHNSVIPKDGSVTKIGDYAFEYCLKLRKISIPDAIVSIGFCAFQNCWFLESVTFGENSQLTIIGAVAFSGCNGSGYGVAGLTSIEIPDGVTVIEAYAFEECDDLKTVTFGENSQLTTIGHRAFEECDRLTSIVLPNTVTTIDSYAFFGCDDLANVVLSSSLTSIGQSAFGDCVDLKSIVIPSSVTSIGKYLFKGCKRLNKVTFEDPNGWYVTETENATSGIDMTLTDESANTSYFQDTYSSFYWYKKAS